MTSITNFKMEEIIEKIETLLSTIIADSNDKNILELKIKQFLNNKKFNIDIRYMMALTMYNTLNNIDKDSINIQIINDIIDNIIEKGVLYNSDEYQIIDQYISYAKEDVKFLEREEIEQLEKRYAESLYDDLGYLFGAKKGTIMGKLNEGIFDINQGQLKEYLKRKNIRFTNDRLSDRMTDDLLIYKIAAYDLIRVHIEYDLNNLTKKFKKENESKNGIYKDNLLQYQKYLNLAYNTGRSIKEKYKIETYRTPFEEIIDYNNNPVKEMPQNKSKH